MSMKLFGLHLKPIYVPILFTLVYDVHHICILYSVANVNQFIFVINIKKSCSRWLVIWEERRKRIRNWNRKNKRRICDKYTCVCYRIKLIQRFNLSDLYNLHLHTHTHYSRVIHKTSSPSFSVTSSEYHRTRCFIYTAFISLYVNDVIYISRVYVCWLRLIFTTNKFKCNWIEIGSMHVWRQRVIVSKCNK